MKSRHEARPHSAMPHKMRASPQQEASATSIEGLLLSKFTASSNEVALHSSHCWEYARAGMYSGFGIITICTASGSEYDFSANDERANKKCVRSSLKGLLATDEVRYSSGSLQGASRHMYASVVPLSEHELRR